MKRQLALVAVALIGFGLNAADAAKNLTLEGVNLGKHVTGPEVSADDLKGKVVVFEYWGDRCPPCIASIPHVTELAAKHGEKVKFVANQVWTKDVNAAATAWKAKAKNDLVSVVNHGAIQGASVKGVPHAFVFNASGELVWQGHPMNGLDKAIDKALAQGSV
jgi:thiol-disulfide isomerase/thioredoxin